MSDNEVTQEAPPIIPPTVGRVVLFFASNRQSEQPHAALVAHVHSERCINVAAFTEDGIPYGATSVRLLQADDPIPTTGEHYATWMPYQLGQAKRNA